MLAHWRGEEEFFFCHWYAETDDDIFAALEAAGFNDLMHTLPNEMQLFLSAETLADKRHKNILISHKAIPPRGEKIGAPKEP